MADLPEFTTQIF